MFDTPATTPSPIPPDIFEDILDHLPTVADLHTLIMTCRLWHLFDSRIESRTQICLISLKLTLHDHS
ncbi:hypothetical protein ABKN59_000634 [Abortiporus biennis]